MEPMSLQHGRLCIELALDRIGLSRTSETARLISDWGEQEDCSAKSPAEMDAAVQLGLELQNAFNEAFRKVYFEETITSGKAKKCLGEVWIEQRLSARGRRRVNPKQVEWVLNRIRERRVHLIEAFFRTYQKTLFGPVKFIADSITGYLRRVVEFESRKEPPPEDQRTVTFADLSLPEGWSAEDLAESHSSSEETLWLVEDEESAAQEKPAVAIGFAFGLMDDYWSEANGFDEEHREEGIASLGFPSAHPVLGPRCHQLLLEKLQGWDEQCEELGRKLSQVLGQIEEIQDQLRHPMPPDREKKLREKLARREARRDNLREEVAEHTRRLLPRPGEVDELLDGVIERDPRRVRFERLNREDEIFLERFQAGASSLQLRFGRKLAAPYRRLLRVLQGHLELKSRLLKPNEHGLQKAERERRQGRMDRWKQVIGGRLLGRIRFALYELTHAMVEVPSEQRQSLQDVLEDAEDLFQFSLIERLGVIGAVGRRNPLRLNRLLRSTTVAK